MPTSRRNHYVPVWYQKGFLVPGCDALHLLDMKPDMVLSKGRPVLQQNGEPRFHYTPRRTPPKRCFWSRDLYTTFVDSHAHDEIERLLFGAIDAKGKPALPALIDNDVAALHKHLLNFFEYLDAQKLRTPKGLTWLCSQYPYLDQNNLMFEMENVQRSNCAPWVECVREIVSAKHSSVKFLVTDHPVTVYNYACDPNHDFCKFPSDPSIVLKGSQTLFPLNQDYCLILTNLEYAREPKRANPLENRTYPRLVRDTMMVLDSLIKPVNRELGDEEVVAINFALKSRANRYVAAGRREWLWPEKEFSGSWKDIGKILLPPKDCVSRRGGKIFWGNDKESYQQDEFGRMAPESRHLDKGVLKNVGANDLCGCGSGKKYKRCCRDKPLRLRPSWSSRSIRERNIVFFNMVVDIIGIDESFVGKEWNYVRKSLTPEKIKKIHQAYGWLWPQDTNIFDLLPKPDGKPRTLYSGMLSPQRAPLVVANAATYFGEILAVNPLIRPGQINKDYCPEKHPHMHMETTFRNIMLFLSLFPLIKSGYVNFFPDPCSFDPFLQRSILHLSDARIKASSLSGFAPTYDKNLVRQGQEEFGDYLLSQLPYSSIKRMLIKQFPEFSEERISDMMDIVRLYYGANATSPPQRKSGEYPENGELLAMSASPNLEMLLFIGQATGASLLTDINYRKKEIEMVSHREGGLVIPRIAGLNNSTTNLPFLHGEGDLNWLAEILGEDKFPVYRNWFGKLHSALHGNSPIDIDNLVEQHDSASEQIKSSLSLRLENNSRMRFAYYAPFGGIHHNHVSILMVQHGMIDRPDRAPLAVFMDVDWAESNTPEEQILKLVRLVAMKNLHYDSA